MRLAPRRPVRGDKGGQSKFLLVQHSDHWMKSIFMPESLL